MTRHYVSYNIRKKGTLLAKGYYEDYDIEVMNNCPYNRLPSVVIAIFKDNKEIHQETIKGSIDSGIKIAKQRIDLLIQEQIKDEFQKKHHSISSQ